MDIAARKKRDKAPRRQGDKEAGIRKMILEIA
jgi:hypothetical protein